TVTLEILVEALTTTVTPTTIEVEVPLLTVRLAPTGGEETVITGVAAAVAAATPIEHKTNIRTSINHLLFITDTTFAASFHVFNLTTNTRL
ncbi:MAG TPA: hypothetical protein VJB87_02875, partial [Candidatus Nanoarchaeia archaeon]|nr:hypothetical protein [Candidatus Nanoarchaeia archaeon]